ncbi:MAG TPA: aldo/keto reductase [Pyrinomonadaceae bacterium]|jgi:predicted aldo/keto reductase-like oxidoreductase
MADAESGRESVAHAGPIPRRRLGRAGVEVSALGLGGYHLGTVQDETEAFRIVHEAIDAGLTFMDNAWEYLGGRGEELMGRALAGRRHEVFLMTKVCTHGRDGRTAMSQLEESLRRLRTDYLDLWQIHEVIYEDDPDLHFAAGGVVEALERARREGKVRHVGFTGHKGTGVLLKMLSHDYAFDACQLPLNCFDATFRSFEREVLPVLRRRGVAPIGMKSLGGIGAPVKKGSVTAVEALRYAMSLPVATTVTGIDSLQVLRQNLGVARGFAPMSAEEMESLRARCAEEAADGRFEYYKITNQVDGPIGKRQRGLPL